jgi:1-deoxy-D-xylulose-5-phosphate synthase
VLAELGLTDQDVARRITGRVAALGTCVSEPEISERLD